MSLLLSRFPVLFFLLFSSPLDSSIHAHKGSGPCCVGGIHYAQRADHRAYKKVGTEEKGKRFLRAEGTYTGL